VLRGDTGTGCEHVFTKTGNGDDTNLGFVGKFVTIGGKENDKLKGRDLPNSLDPAFASNAKGDAIYGKGGKDVLKGGEGPDDLFGGAGKDKLFGGDGQDALIDDDGTVGDAIFAGPGVDFIFAADGAFTAIDCGDDTDQDHIWKDGIDTLAPNCAATAEFGNDVLHLGGLGG
jgi:Ca2+-binding RTX toxin-like protein